MYNNQPQLFEGLEKDNLARLIYPELHVDEFKSKMGEDADIIVLSFLVDGKEPATDLMNFIERGYDWVLDADISSGELDDGDYLVFVELERSPKAAEDIYDLVDNVLNLTGQKLSEWSFLYRKNSRKFDITVDNLRQHVPLTPDSYIKKFGEESSEVDDNIDAMLEAARVPIFKKAPVNDFTESLRVAAGLK
jgi:hypothetical protein